MSEICADCGSREFKSCFTESFPSRAHDGTSLVLTLRLCLTCGARFPERSQLRTYLLDKLPTPSRERLRA